MIQYGPIQLGPGCLCYYFGWCCWGCLMMYLGWLCGIWDGTFRVWDGVFFRGPAVCPKKLAKLKDVKPGYTLKSEWSKALTLFVSVPSDRSSKSYWLKLIGWAHVDSVSWQCIGSLLVVCQDLRGQFWSVTLSLKYDAFCLSMFKFENVLYAEVHGVKR